MITRAEIDDILLTEMGGIPQEIRDYLDYVEELELFKSEHLRLEAELNVILHPNTDGPTAPSFCDWSAGNVTECGVRTTEDFSLYNFCPYCGGKIIVDL